MHLEIVFLVNSDQKTMLQESLNFLKVVELRDICQQFSIDENGVKNHLVTRIIHFLVTGQIIHEPIIPQISRAQRGYLYPLVPTTLILKGSYKNDLRTRLFFKQLIGDYFHFTAFGIDWVYERWMRENHPTYQEFADMWCDEYKKRKELGSPSKQEWAYINFTQKFIENYPQASRAEIINAWEIERQRHKKRVATLLKEFFLIRQ